MNKKISFFHEVTGNTDRHFAMSEKKCPLEGKDVDDMELDELKDAESLGSQDTDSSDDEDAELLLQEELEASRLSRTGCSSDSDMQKNSATSSQPETAQLPMSTLETASGIRTKVQEAISPIPWTSGPSSTPGTEFSLPKSRPRAYRELLKAEQSSQTNLESQQLSFQSPTTQFSSQQLSKKCQEPSDDTAGQYTLDDLLESNITEQPLPFGELVKKQPGLIRNLRANSAARWRVLTQPRNGTGSAGSVAP